MDAYHTETIEVSGHKFRVEHHYDESMGLPWAEHDGHGIITEGHVDWYTARIKKTPGQVVMWRRGHDRVWLYDVQKTMAKARTEGWGPHGAAEGLTERQRTALAVQQDMARMRDWCADNWHWCGVVVVPLTEDGDELRSKTQSLWGIESDSGDYLGEVARELAEGIAESLGVPA